MSAAMQTATIKPSQSRHVIAVLGPNKHRQDASCHRSHARPRDGVDRSAPAASGAGGHDKIVAMIGPNEVALITGEEKIKPSARAIGSARLRPCRATSRRISLPWTISSWPPILTAAMFHRAAFPCARHERDASARRSTMADPIRELIPGANFIARPRLSKLTYLGQKDHAAAPAPPSSPSPRTTSTPSPS